MLVILEDLKRKILINKRKKCFNLLNYSNLMILLNQFRIETELRTRLFVRALGVCLSVWTLVPDFHGALSDSIMY